jgi:hypothetical protein
MFIDVSRFTELLQLKYQMCGMLNASLRCGSSLAIVEIMAPPKEVFRVCVKQNSRNVQGTFREHSGTFRGHLGTLREHSGNILPESRDSGESLR